MIPSLPSRDLTRITLAILVLGLMIVMCLWILQPFFAATVWATMIVVATWPMMQGVQARLGGQRWAAVTVMTLAMLLVLVVPIVLALATIADHADQMVEWSKAIAAAGIPSPPGWVEQVPLVGKKIAREWQQLAAISSEDLVARVTPYVSPAVRWFAAQAGSLGLMMLQFLLIVVITAILYSMGETAARSVRRFARRLADERGERSVVLAGQAIRAVALGIVVTALAQSTFAGIGLAVTGVPYAAGLTAIIFVLCIAQLGPLLVLAPAVGWLYWTGDPVWGTVLLVWTVVVSLMDNFLRPVLIRQGSDLPLLLILVGVIGGLISMGVIGLFVGPTVLAVAYRLLESWISDIDRPGAESGSR